MTKTQALFQFFNSFGIPAYPLDSVPDDTVFPWITYEVSIAGFGSEAYISAHLYYYTASEAVPNAKVEEIAEQIGESGITIPYDKGIIWIKKGSPYSNSPADQNDPSIKHRVLNLVLEFL